MGVNDMGNGSISQKSSYREMLQSVEGAGPGVKCTYRSNAAETPAKLQSSWKTLPTDLTPSRLYEI